MSIELIIFLLRLLAGLSLLAFLLTLFIVIWRNLNHIGAEASAARPAHGYLVCEHPQQAAAIDRWSLRPILTLGRASSSDIIVPDDFASAEHARIILENGKWWLEDRQSRNGTHLNEDKIQRRTILADGDVIGIGGFRFRIIFG